MSNMLIIGDLHFGIKANSQEYLSFQLDWFRNELKYNIKNNNVKHLVYLGDINDSRISLSPLIMKHQRDIFLEMKKEFPEVEHHVILGNHDLYYRNTRDIHSLTFLKDIGYKVYEQNTEVIIEGKKILFVPWILKHEMEDFKLLLANNKYDILFGHLEIQGFAMVKGVLDTDGWRHSIFDNCKRVYSGHYHIRSKKGNIQYVGNPFELTHNDAYSVKGIDMLDLSTMNNKFIKSKYIPRHLKIISSEVPFDQLNKELVENNMLKVILGKDLSEVQKIEYQERINSLKPFKVIYEDQEDLEMRVNDVEIQNSLKDTLSFLEEFLGIVDIEENIDKSEIMDEFKVYFNKAHI